MTISPGNDFSPVQQASSSALSSPQSTNLGDILERVLDTGIVIAGDIRVNLLDIELLTIKLRLVVASLETAKEAGINWWENDPWLTGKSSQLELENERLRERIEELENGSGRRRAVTDRAAEYGDVD
ncbi:gas vesicle protein GvpA [Mycobacterium colombiense]|uniref:gas vesicle protein n=1 Tax=Mycobacterium colombiense TaxID=339268 RepID=UPI00096F4B77|nr:gas vesicle protein GvpA [Mycobacterium colombiense]OMC16399.1 gas vesicle protein GvpA [Mycobacterium colombiense]OMC34740.1 gas vesicle protein GvpA [Mycobacterium colombiense]